jgi:translation initiation factor 2 subunit 1
VFSKIKITEEQKKALVSNIHKKMAAKPMKIRSRFNLHCYTYEGIEAIKESLLEAKRQTSDDKFSLVFQLIAPPEYKVEVVTLDKNGGVERLEQALAIIQEEIKKRGGNFKLVQGPTRIGTRADDVDNQDIIDNLNRKMEEEESSGEENNDEGMGDVDLENDDDVQIEESD